MSSIPVQSQEEQTRNFKLLYLDALLGVFPGIAGAFSGAFAIRLGATNTEIGLLSSIPALLAIFISIPIGRILQRSTRKMFWPMCGLTLYRVGFMLVALAPWIHFAFITPAVYFIGILILIFIPIQFFNIGNVGILIEIVPENRRAAVFTNRNMIGAVVTILGIFLAGQWLSHAKWPGNYQILFLVTGFVAIFSLFAWLGLHFPPKGENVKVVESRKNSLRDQVKELVRIFQERPGFTRFIINNLLVNIGLWMVGPLYVLYTVRQLQASDAWIGLSGTVATACSLVGWLVGKRLVELWGDGVTARRLILLAGIYPILVGLTPSLTLILIFGGFINLFNPGISLGMNNLFFRVLPVERRDDSVAIYSTIMSIGPFIFPLIGVTLAGHFGFSATLIGCGILAMLGSLSFWVWRIRMD
jgi:MFS family permease